MTIFRHPEHRGKRFLHELNTKRLFFLTHRHIGHIDFIRKMLQSNHFEEKTMCPMSLCVKIENRAFIYFVFLS
jgi:hypothetical protein